MDIGQVYGQLTILSEAQFYGGTRFWNCLCLCGKETCVSQRNLISGHTKSCGCLKKQNYRLMAEGTCIDLLASTKLPRSNTSGHKGVSLNKQGKWVSYITLRKKRYYLGSYETFEAAKKAREKAEAEMFRPLIHKYYGSQNETLL